MPNEARFILLVGGAGSGRRTFADHFVRKDKTWRHMRISTHISNVSSALFGAKPEEFDTDPTRPVKLQPRKTVDGVVSDFVRIGTNRVIPSNLMKKLKDSIVSEVMGIKAMKLGEARTYIGSIFRKKFGSGFWAKTLLSDVRESGLRNVIVSDCTRVCEVETIRSRSASTAVITISRKSTNIDDKWSIESDSTIQNDGTKKEFFVRIEAGYVSVSKK